MMLPERIRWKVAIAALVVASTGLHCQQTTAPRPDDTPAVAIAIAMPSAMVSSGPVAPQDAPVALADVPIASASASASATPTVEGARAVCASRASVRMPDGSTSNCYPYRCRNGACLEACSTRLDCAGAQTPAEMARHGYPLECMPSGKCVPMPPEKLH